MIKREGVKCCKCILIDKIHPDGVQKTVSISIIIVLYRISSGQFNLHRPQRFYEYQHQSEILIEHQIQKSITQEPNKQGKMSTFLLISSYMVFKKTTHGPK